MSPLFSYRCDSIRIFGIYQYETGPYRLEHWSMGFSEWLRLKKASNALGRAEIRVSWLQEDMKKRNQPEQRSGHPG